MNSTDQASRSQRRFPVVPIVIGFVSGFVTAGAVSWATPDGNLVVTLVPALAVGFTVFRLALWRYRRGGAK